MGTYVVLLPLCTLLWEPIFPGFVCHPTKNPDMIVSLLGTNDAGGAALQLGPCAVNRQCAITSLPRIHSLYPAFVNTCCRYALY